MTDEWADAETIGEQCKVRRDRWGRYLVVPPNGGKPAGYTRATTLADTLSDKENLFAWSQVMSLTGLMRRPGLRAKFEALLSRHPHSGPWYGGADAKAACKEIARECKEAGGATDRADIGTALHDIILEQAIRGQQTLITQPETAADVEAFTKAVEAHGLRIDPAMTEVVVVHDEWATAGTADMLVVEVAGGRFICDLKTAATLDFSHDKIAMQLAIYANANNVYRQGVAVDGSDDQRLPMPGVSKDRALVVHLPAGEARCELHWVDIAAGAEAVAHALWVRGWRKRKGLFTPFTSAPTLRDDAGAERDIETKDDVIRRYHQLSDGDRPTFKRLKAERGIDNDDVAGLMQLLADIDGWDHVHTEPVALPTPEPTPARPEPPDEGDTIAEDDTFKLLGEKFQALPDAATEWIADLIAQSRKGHSFELRPFTRTVRRFELHRGLIAIGLWAEFADLGPDAVNEAIVTPLAWAAAGSDDAVLFANMTPGVALGSLNAEQAAEFARLAQRYVDGVHRTQVDEQGRWRLSGSRPPARTQSSRAKRGDTSPK